MTILNGLTKALSTLPTTITPRSLMTATEMRVIGNELTIYPEDGGERYIDKGYKRNDAVYSISSKNASETAQVRLYHLTVKRTETNTAAEYQELKKGPVNDLTLKEMAKMKKAMTENFIVDSPLSKLLNKPNRRQAQSEWIENLILWRELTGEGNIWLNIPEGAKTPLEMFCIPKPQLVLIGDGANPWNIVAYEFILSGNTYRWPTENVVMWNYANPSEVDATSLSHLRGLSPLQAGVTLMQAMNEADVRVATSNKNGGAAGLAFRTDLKEAPTVEQRADMRQQFNAAVNSNEMANKIAILGGEWGYFNFAVSVKDQQLIEQYGIGFKRMCRIFNTPAQIFDEGNGTWDNQRQAYRHWIYSKIGRLAHGLTTKLNDALLPKFGLDPERHLIDGDIMTLPAMASDLKEQVAALKDASWLSDNEKRAASGYEEKESPIMSLTQREYEMVSIGGNLDEDVRRLNS